MTKLVSNLNFKLKSYNSQNQSTIKFEKRIINNKEKLLTYIWFLTDTNDKIHFWNNHVVECKKGSILIFPASWCFPYKEINECNKKKIILYGNLYRS